MSGRGQIARRSGTATTRRRTAPPIPCSAHAVLLGHVLMRPLRFVAALGAARLQVDRLPKRPSHRSMRWPVLPHQHRGCLPTYAIAVMPGLPGRAWTPSRASFAATLDADIPRRVRRARDRARRGCSRPSAGVAIAATRATRPIRTISPRSRCGRRAHARAPGSPSRSLHKSELSSPSTTTRGSFLHRSSCSSSGAGPTGRTRCVARRARSMPGCPNVRWIGEIDQRPVAYAWPGDHGEHRGKARRRRRSHNDALT